MAPYIPAPLVAILSAAGIAAIRLEGSAWRGIKGQRTIVLPAPSQWAEGKATTIDVGVAAVPLTWLALGTERVWATGGPVVGVAAADRADRRQSSANR